MKKQFLNTKEAAHYTGFAAGTLTQFRYHKKGCRYYKHGNKIVYSVDDLNDWIKSNPVLGGETMSNENEDTTPFIWLNEDEEEGRADCGCTLIRDYEGGGPAFIMCPRHLAGGKTQGNEHLNRMLVAKACLDPMSKGIRDMPLKELRRLVWEEADRLAVYPPADPALVDAVRATKCLTLLGQSNANPIVVFIYPKGGPE